MSDGAGLAGIGDDDQPTERGRLALLFWAAAIASLVLPRLPYGRLALYPFALLGTWAHELGHGITAVVVGGSFERLEVYRNLGGVAFHAGTGEVGGALVSAGGLLGPAIAGALVIVYGARPSSARWLLAIIGALVVLSVVLVVRNVFGAVALTGIGVALVALGVAAPNVVRIGLAQLVGIQLCVASWSTLDYMFTSRFTRDGRTLDSDTQNIADVLLLPYWFWGGLIAALSLVVMAYAFYRAWLRPVGRTAPDTPSLT